MKSHAAYNTLNTFKKEVRLKKRITLSKIEILLASEVVFIK